MKYKKANFKQFRDNVLKHCVSYTIGKFDFTKAYNLMEEFCISHTFRVAARYNKKNDITYFFMFDDGYFSIFDSISSDQEGFIFKMDGKHKIEDLMHYKNIDKLLTIMYNECEREISNRIKAKDNAA